MNLNEHFDQQEHDNVIIECFSHLWKHSVDFMFIMAVEENGEFSLYDNNPASRIVMGMDPDKPIHRYNIRETWGDEIVEGLYATYRKAIEARKPVSFDQFATTGDNPIYVNTLFVPIFGDNGEPKFVCGVSRDVSKIKEAEQTAISANAKLKEYTEALENINDDLDNKVKDRTQELEKLTSDLKVALEAKSAFVSRVSHEIRTPINAMLGLSNLLKKTELDDIQQDYIDKILDAGNVLMGVVNDILDFSKLEAEKLHPEHIRFNPQEIIRKAFNISSFKAYEKCLEPTLRIDPALPRYLMGDPLRIQQIIINLLSNAVKFTERGSTSLQVTYDTNTCKTHYLQVVVTDTGIGMSPEQQKRLFIPFNQADNSITRNYGGTGLGLMICKKLCELMGGTIQVDSQLGKGSCFKVRIPLNIAEEEADQSHSAENSADDTKNRSPQSLPPNLSAYRLLLVDDNPINQQVAAGFLKDSGIHIDIASDGEMALENIRHASYDIILMDLQMPKMDGISATRQIRTTLNQSIPIIALTAHANEATISDCLENGMNAHLSKPLDADELYRVLAGYLDAAPDSAGCSLPESPQTATNSTSLINRLTAVNGLNVKEALSRLHHSNELFLSLVQSFYSRYHGSLLLTQGSKALSPAQLADEIHSLKSNCAYIGAQKLSSKCTILEQKLRSGESVNAEPIVNGLRGLITHLHPLFGTKSERPQNSAQKPMSLKSCLARMKTQLEQSDFRVEQTLLQVKALLTDDRPLAASIAYIETLVEDVEFEQALEVSRPLIAGFSGTGTVVDGK